MYGWRIHAWTGDLIWEQFEAPTPGADEALVEVEACGIGRTVEHYIRGSLSTDPSLLPRVPGHELVGTVREVGDAAAAGLVGRRVMAYFYLICGTCPTCRRDAEPRCPRLGGRIGVHRDGGYAPLTALPVRNLVALPEDIDPVAATVIPDAVATPVHIARRTGIGPDDRVAVIGAGGGVGIHMIQVATQRGAEVVGLDIGAEKADAIAAFARARNVRGGLEAHPADDLFAGGRPTAVVDFAGRPETLAWAFDGLAPGGRMAILASYDDVSFTFAPRRLVLGELTVLGSLYASRAELVKAAELVADGSVRPVISRTVAPSDIPEVHAEIRAGTLPGRGAVRWRVDG